MVGFALQEEFLLKGSWRTVSHDVNRGTSPQAVSAALLGGAVLMSVHVIKNVLFTGLRQLQQELRGSL